ncbi:hypothetical protein H5410_004890, partial [Solanum commersonii]
AGRSYRSHGVSLVDVVVVILAGATTSSKEKGERRETDQRQLLVVLAGGCCLREELLPVGGCPPGWLLFAVSPVAGCYCWCSCRLSSADAALAWLLAGGTCCSVDLARKEESGGTAAHSLYHKDFTNGMYYRLDIKMHQITYQDKATQTETEEEDTIEKILKAITTLCIKVDSMDNEIQKLKTNEDNLKSKASQQHDYKNAKLRQSEDGKNSELKGDDGKLLKTHNVCLNTAAAPVEILYEEIKPPIQVIKIGLTKDMIIPEDIGQQEEICKIEIPNFYANKRIIGISTIIQELANNYLNGNVIWSYYSRDQLMIYFNSRELRKADMDEVQR